jgi:putative sterol carrier protein
MSNFLAKEIIMKVFSNEWAQAYFIAINHNQNYKDASQKWEEGSIALILIHPSNAVAVWVDLLKGECIASKSLPPETAIASATFAIEGDEATWKEVLNGNLQPLMAIMRGKLKLVKGSIARLLPYTKAANELVLSAQTIPTEFE